MPSFPRVHKRADYLRIQERGRKLASSCLLAFIFPTPGLKEAPVAGSTEAGPARFGITASKRVGNAVVRNRVKRLLRESIRHQQKDAPLGMDVVFVAKNTANQASYDKIFAEVRWILQKIATRRAPC